MTNINDEAPPPSYQSAMNLLQRPTITQQPGHFFIQFHFKHLFVQKENDKTR